MTYICTECGNQMEYEDVMKNNMKCRRCTEKRSNVWIKKRSTEIKRVVLAR